MSLPSLLLCSAVLASSPADVRPIADDVFLASIARAEESVDAVSARADDSVDALIARGRTELAAGRAAEAQKIFEEAEKKDSRSLRTRVWVLRSWMAQNRMNDALNAIDELSKGGAKGPEIDYLYGMAFGLTARTHIEQGNGGGVIEMNLKDAVNFLARATKADPERFSDAFPLLAVCAWNTQDLDVGRAAAEQAAARQPKNADAQLMLGRIALKQYSAISTDESQKALADKHWETGRAALAKAIELLASASDVESKKTLAKAHVDLGHASIWKGKLDDAVKEYGLALGADCSVVNFQPILAALGSEKFLAALEAGEKAFKDSSGPTANGDAALLWWLGWARFDQKQYDKADAALSEAVAKNASFINSWYWIALARYYQKNYEGAVLALGRYHDENAADLAQSIKTNADLNLKILDFLVGWCAQQQKNLEAAILSETQAAVAPQNADYWNNAGLFYREAGAALRKSDKAEDRTQAASDFEKSYAAYTKALEIAPDNPSLLNDTAVMLHYYLDRDLDKAKAMYVNAAEKAEAELKRTDLDADTRDRLQTALRDSKNNLAKLEKGDKKEN